MKYILLLTLLFGIRSVRSQSIYFSFKDNTQAAYNLTDVRNITFTGDVMNLNKTDGSTIAWNVSTINNYHFEQGILSISEEKNTTELIIYPNPAQSKIVTIVYQQLVEEQVNIGIYDMKGNPISNWAVEHKDRGRHELIWQTENMPKGSYILRLSTHKGSLSKTIVLQ